jgi:hypothetical protein
MRMGQTVRGSAELWGSTASKGQGGDADPRTSAAFDPACQHRPPRSTVLIACLPRFAPLSLFLQVRTQVLNNDLAAHFKRWYPGFTHHGDPVELAA